MGIVLPWLPAWLDFLFMNLAFLVIGLNVRPA